MTDAPTPTLGRVSIPPSDTPPPSAVPQPPASPQPPSGAQQLGFAPAQPPTPPATGPRNPLGLIAFVLGLATILVGLMQTVAQTFLLVSSDYTAIGAWNMLFLVLNSLLAIAIVIIAIVGLLQRDRPKVLAGIGLGIGISTLAGILISGLLAPALLSAIAG